MSAEIASAWADRLVHIVETALSPDPRLRGLFHGTTACLSALFRAGRHEEILALLDKDRLPFWPYREWMSLSFDLALRDPWLIRERVRRRGGDPAGVHWPRLWLEGEAHEYVIGRDPVPPVGVPRRKLVVLAEERQTFVPARTGRLAAHIRRAWEQSLDAVASADRAFFDRFKLPRYGRRERTRAVLRAGASTVAAAPVHDVVNPAPALDLHPVRRRARHGGGGLSGVTHRWPSGTNGRSVGPT